MRPYLRVVLELFGPAFFGGVQAMITGMVGSKGPAGLFDILKGLFVFFFFALMFCSIQSVCFTVLMELAYRCGLRRRSWRAIALSTFLGVVSGASFMLYSDSGVQDSSLLLFCSVGGVVGLLISSIIFLCESDGKPETA